MKRFRPTNKRLIRENLLLESNEVGRPFDEIEAPSPWKTYCEFTVDVDVNEMIVASSESEHSYYGEESPIGYPVVHPVVLLRLGAKTIHRDFIAELPPGQSNLHARIDCEFLRPARVGERFRLEGRLAERYRKRAKRYLVYEGRFWDDSGEIVMRYRQTRMVGRDVDG